MSANNLLKTRIKKKKPRTSKDLDVVHIGFAPKYDEMATTTDSNYNRQLRQSLRHYGYFNSVKDLKKNVIQWLTDGEFRDTSFIKQYAKSADWRTPMTACSLVTAVLEDGMPISVKHQVYILDNVDQAVAKMKEDGLLVTKADPTVKAPPSIQDRIADKVNNFILFFEEKYEDGIIERKEKHNKPELIADFKSQDIPASMVKPIAEYFQKQWDEIKGSQGVKADEQLKEAYAHLKPADIRRFTAFYKAFAEQAESYYAEKKVAKAPRRRKPVPKAKQVAKMKYQKENVALKLRSTSPTDIIDAKVVWIYNTKTRKLGQYHASMMDGGMAVKGTTIIGFDPQKSISKTLRKPKEQLAAFKKASKVKLRTFLKDIKAVDIKLTGRMNADIVILKAY